MKTEERLGNLIEGTDARRDAAHVAIAPATAQGRFYPGQLVGYKDGYATLTGDPVGVVDPFLKAPVMPGELFWILMFPNTVKGLRHEWDHPAFKNQEYEAEVVRIELEHVKTERDAARREANDLRAEKEAETADEYDECRHC